MKAADARQRLEELEAEHGNLRVTMRCAEDAPAAAVLDDTPDARLERRATGHGCVGRLVEEDNAALHARGVALYCGFDEELAGNHLLNSVLRTAVGDVTVFIPSNVAVTVRAQNESGNRATRIVSDFPEIRLQPAVMGIAVAEGALNGGGPILNVSTSNGAIYLRRQK